MGTVSLYKYVRTTNIIHALTKFSLMLMLLKLELNIMNSLIAANIEN